MSEFSSAGLQPGGGSCLEENSLMKKVLITGASGLIGGIVLNR
jgi:hypothetical protein